MEDSLLEKHPKTQSKTTYMFISTNLMMSQYMSVHQQFHVISNTLYKGPLLSTQLPVLHDQKSSSFALQKTRSPSWMIFSSSCTWRKGDRSVRREETDRFVQLAERTKKWLKGTVHLGTIYGYCSTLLGVAHATVSVS